MNTQKNTIIYGGAFNPPTRAHQAILQACVERAETLDADVWLLPSGDRTDKKIGVSRDRRIEMIQALAGDVVSRGIEIAIQETEIDRIEQTETYDTVQEFNNAFPDRRFTWVFGSDSIATMPQWHGGEWMMNNLDMLIINRVGTPIVALGRYAVILPVETINTSSTEVRKKIADHLPIENLVSPSVLQCLNAEVL
ncbi:nicotinate-nicotinamide nucleotide adenylyltransferase [Candidatus Saccharibacteria bacterium]|nr:nicotinate-nicotinamide nucleotide adenylyltransferase [Candidatus Saccharibacteria bacterium]